MYITSKYPDIPPYQEANIHHFLLNRPDQTSWDDHIVLVDVITNREVSFPQFRRRVYNGMSALALPTSLGGLGFRIGQNEIVGIMSENSIGYIGLVHSLLALTIPFVSFAPYSTAFELEHAVRLTKITRLFVSPPLLPLALRICIKCGLPDANIYTMSGSVDGRLSLEALLDSARTLPPVEIKPAKRDTLAYLILSSGTTGPSKAVMISHDNLVFTVKQIQVVFSHSPTPSSTPTRVVNLGFLPLHHTYGLQAYCIRHFLMRATLTVVPGWDTDLALKTIAQRRVTTINLIPSLMHQLVHHPKISEADLSSLDFVTSGASYLPPDLEKKFAALGSKERRFVNGYGMSELTLSAISTPPPGLFGGDPAMVPHGSSGILVPGVEARILREDGSEADVNEIGELWLRGRNVALGYWNNEEANKKTFVRGWLRTGDRFRADKNGWFFFEDRAKDTLKVSGMQVSPLEIERLLLAHPKKYVADASVAGVRGGRTSDELNPRAWIVLSAEGKAVSPQKVVAELQAWTQANLSKYKWLRGGIEIIDEIPKSPVGKVLRRVLQDRYHAALPKGRL